MRVTQINPYVRTSQPTAINRMSKPSFGHKSQYLSVFDNAMKTQFSKTDAALNKSLVENMFTQLVNATKAFPEASKDYFYGVLNNYNNEGIYNFLNSFRVAGIAQRLADVGRGAAVDNRKISLLNDNNQEYVSFMNLGRYETGLVSESKHDQEVIQFRNPQTDDYIGFSLDVDKNLAITRNGERVELYDDFAYKTYSTQGYKPMIYEEYLEKNGKQAEPSFWDWLRGF